MNRHFRALVPGVLLAVALTLPACQNGETSGDGNPAAASIAPPAAVKDAGQLTFCSDIAYPPMEFYEGSEPAGLDVEMGGDLAQRMGVDAEFKNIGYDGIIAALHAGQCDAIVSSMTVTPDREEQVDFVAYANVGPAILVQKGNPDGIRSVDDLGGKSAAVQVGTTTKQFLERANGRLSGAGRPSIGLEVFPKDTDAASALRAGRVDAWVSDSPPIADYARKNPELFEQVVLQEQAAPIGMAVPKDDAELSRALTRAVKAAYDDGTMKRLLAKWQLPNIALR